MAARTGGGAGREERYQPSLPTTVVCLLLLTLAVLVAELHKAKNALRRGGRRALERAEPEKPASL